MPLTRVTKDTGATINPGPMLTAEPQLVLTSDQLAENLIGTDPARAFIADTIVGCYVHENMGINLFRTLSGATTNSMLQDGFEKILAETEQAMVVYENLQERIGIPLGYIPPIGRCIEATDQHLLMSLLASGSADIVAMNMCVIDLAMISAGMCVANVELLEQITSDIQDQQIVDAINDAVEELKGPAEEHLLWAKTMKATMAKAVLASAANPV